MEFRVSVDVLAVPLGLVEDRGSGECQVEPRCPHQCRCAEGIVDCREKALTHIPEHLPESATEL